MSTTPKSHRTTSGRHSCEAPLRGGSAWSRYTHACGKTAKFERGGKWYCGTHDPVRVEAKRAERDAKWDREIAESSAKFRLEQAAPHLRDALRDLLDVISADELIPESVSYMKQARAAIAKAEGR